MSLGDRQNSPGSAPERIFRKNLAANRGHDATEQRAVERDLVSYLGIASYGDSQTFQVELTDLSAQGARMVSQGDFAPPTDFVLKIPETGACFLSELSWQDGRACGVRFLKPLP